MVKSQTSESATPIAQRQLEGETRPVYVYHFGDHDVRGPESGTAADDKPR